MGLQEGEVTQAVVETLPHIVLVWTKAFAIGIFALTFCGILLKVYFDRTIPSIVKNRVLFGMLIFAMLVFLVDRFGDDLSDDSKGMLIIGIMGAIATIIYFLYDKDKEVDDHDGSDDTEADLDLRG